MLQPEAMVMSEELLSTLLFVMTTVPPSEPEQVMVEGSEAPSNVTVLPVRLNVPFWVKERSMVILVPL